MSLEISAPIAGSLFGPGWNFEVHQSDTGPYPAGSFWQIEIEGPPGEVAFCTWIINTGTPFVSHFMRNGTDDVTLPTVLREQWSSGQPGRFRVRFFTDGVGYTQDDHVDIVIDREQGQVNEKWLLDNSRGVGAGLGLTTEEHNAVLQTNVGVIAMAGINPLDWIGDLAQAFQTNPPLSFGSLSTTYTLTGDGAMPDIGDVFHTKLGIYFIATIPAGLSHRHGQSEEYPDRLIQFRTVHQLAGLETVTEVADFDTHGELWRWRVGKPSRIEYSVTPGVVVSAQWWQFP